MLSANTFNINLMKKITRWILTVTKLFWGSVKNRSNTRCQCTTTRTRSSMKSTSFRLKITPLMFYDCYIYVSRWLINWFGKKYIFFLHMFYEVLNIIYIADFERKKCDSLFIILFARWLLKRNYLFIYFLFITFLLLLLL